MTKTHEEAVAAAMKDARARGLPDGWSVKFDNRNRRKWISPGPQSRTYDSLPKALAKARKMGYVIPETPSSQSTSTASSSKKRSASSAKSASSKRSRKHASPKTITTSAEAGRGIASIPRNSVDSVSTIGAYESAGVLTGTTTTAEVGYDGMNLDPNDDIEPEPESDPETAFDHTNVSDDSESLTDGGGADAVTASYATTVHWDPNSPEGRKVGYRIRIFDQSKNKWRYGRVVRYDPRSTKHKIQYYNNAGKEVNCEWLRLPEESTQCGSRFVWALVKGFAWWPALVLDCDPPMKSANKEGYVYVDFFGSDQFAAVKDTPDFVRPFDNGEVDDVIKKNKKKRDADSIELACEEQAATREARNKAVQFYAEKAFAFANNRANDLLGRRVEFFRSDVNYPYGDTVSGTVRAYSSMLKKWLISYEQSQSSKATYEPGWINLKSKDSNFKILDKDKRKRSRTPSDIDLAPFTFGYTSENVFMRSHPPILENRCTGCREEYKSDKIFLECSNCSCTYHHGCIDPPLNIRAAKKILVDGEKWLCHRCTRCRGCKKLDIAFGSQVCPTPPTLFTDDKSPLVLCSTCIPLYKKDRYCPVCAHCWDDVKYQKTQRIIRWKIKKKLEAKKNKSRKRKKGLQSSLDRPQTISCDDNSVVSRSSVGTTVSVDSDVTDPSWYYADSAVWGFNEGSMIVCDDCNLWVHAGCANLSREEYDQTNAGDHPVYSKEFLCRFCCKRRCEALVTALKAEDEIFLFATPVTEQMAPNYRDVIKNPMDLQTMTERVKNDVYYNYAWVRESFELMVLNALKFNRPHTKFWNEAKRYHEVCMEKVFSKLGHAAPAGRYTDALHDEYASAQRAKEMEIERVQQDETTEKKDLVAGAQVTSVKLEPLIKPTDPESCFPFTSVHLKQTDAFYSAWMECCIACGSSGAMDTMLFCVDCGEAYHSFCCNAPIHSMRDSALLAWRCPNCKICEISGEVPEDETKLLYCEMCDRAFTLDLLDPPLESVPTGLWICGQCVDCKECGNKGEKGIVSRKYWSRDPHKCFRCGGCKGLVEEHVKGMECPICTKIWRANDTDIVKCSSCGLGIHAACDKKADDFILNRDAYSQKHRSSAKYKPSYECPLCRRREEDKENAVLLQQHLYKQALSIIDQGRLAPGESMCSHELHQNLSEACCWELREFWREEYKSLLVNGEKMVEVVKEKLKGKIQKLITHPGDNRDIPPWVISRAARWLRHLKHSQHKKISPEPTIIQLVMLAKMASSFLHLACETLGLDPHENVTCPERMSDLLISPSNDGDIVDYFPDTAKTTCNEQIIQPDEWTVKYWNDSCAVKRDADKKLKLNSRYSSDSNRMVQNGVTKLRSGADACMTHGSSYSGLNAGFSPMKGWGEQCPPSGQKLWRDSRSCCICHTCGDDDAGLPLPCDDEMKSRDGSDFPLDPKKNLDIARVGRLLPISGGLWVHASCALWSSEVWECANDGLIHAVDKARYRGSKLKCFGCGRPGATLGCHKPNCSSNYHFLCAKACGAIFTTKQQMYCRTHRQIAKDVLECESFELMKPLKVNQERSQSIGMAESNICFRLGTLVVHSLGSIEQDHDGFHSKNYITPPGYASTRIFWSFRNIRKRTLYMLKVTRTNKGEPLFTITAADDPKTAIRGRTVHEAYNALIIRVRKANHSTYSNGDFFSSLPMKRKREKNLYALNGPQFFGFGLKDVRKALESCQGIAAVTVPLEKDSPVYKFCFSHPEEDDIKGLQRKRAAAAAEKALENASGCARTEGSHAFVRSGGSGRITLALVRNADEVSGPPHGQKSHVRGRHSPGESKSEMDSNQAKYDEMKSVPMDQRLAAKRSHIHGWGLFTKAKLRKHAMIVEYMGETVRQCIADKRERAYEKSGIGSCYMFRLDQHRIVDATTIGCMARFMNHCCQPNAYANVITVNTEQGLDKKIVVFANRDIQAGEEITYDYKFPVEDGSLRCTCGAPNCIGRMN